MTYIQSSYNLQIFQRCLEVDADVADWIDSFTFSNCLSVNCMVETQSDRQRKYQIKHVTSFSFLLLFSFRGKYGLIIYDILYKLIDSKV